MAFANLPSIFILLLYLKYVNGQGMMNNMNMGFNVPPAQQQLVPNFNNFNQALTNPTVNPNIPQQSPTPSTNNLQLKQVNLQVQSKHPINGQPPLNVQQNNLQKPNIAPAANLQLPKQANQIQTNDINVAQTPKAASFPQQAFQVPSQGTPMPLQITSFNFIPVDQMPFGPQNQLPYAPSVPPSTFSAQMLPQSLQTILNYIPVNPLNSQQNLLPSLIPTLQNQFDPMGNPQIFAQPSFGPFQNQPILTGIPNQSPFNPGGPGLIALQAQQPPYYMENQPGFIPLQDPSVFNYLSDHQPSVLPMQLQPVVTYQGQPEVNSLPGSATYIPFSPQYAPAVPIYASLPPYNPPPKSNKTSSLKAILPYIINLLQERQRCPCPNCGCVNNDQPPQILEGYANLKNYGTLNEQNLPVVTIGSENVKKKSRFLREHKNPKKNVVNIESEELSDEDSAELIDDGEDNTSDSD